MINLNIFSIDFYKIIFKNTVFVFQFKKIGLFTI
jgi:hypothetical protein